MKNFPSIDCRPLLCAAAGLLILLAATTGSTPALAQASDAADRCTPDVMRLCSEYIPDADRIVVCLKAKRKQLTPSCLTALTAGKEPQKTKTSGKAPQKVKKRRAHREG